MLVNSSVSAGALVGDGSEYCGKKEMTKNGDLRISISLCLRRKTERSWEAVEPSCLVVEVILYSTWLGLEISVLVEESSSIDSKEYITPRLSWSVPPLLLC